MNFRKVFLLWCLLLTSTNCILAENILYNVLLIESYNPNTQWTDEALNGLKEGFKFENVNVNILTRYLDADNLTFEEEKARMREFVKDARNESIDLIITNSDEALYLLMESKDSLVHKLPIVFMGVKYPNVESISQCNNVSGYTSQSNFNALLNQAHRLFPDRNEVICLTDSSALANRGSVELMKAWDSFCKRNPSYHLRIINTQAVSLHTILSTICSENNAKNSVVILPKWSPFLAFIGKNAKAPFFSTQKISLNNGVLCVYDTDPFTVAFETGQQAANILKGAPSSEFGVKEGKSSYIYDYKQLDFFNVDKLKVKEGEIYNLPYWAKYKIWILIVNVLLIVLFIIAIIRLIQINRRETIKRMIAQTRLSEQRYLVNQRNEFDNILHSISEAVITYDIDGKIRFANKSLLLMLQIPFDKGARSHEGFDGDTLFHIYCNGEEIFQDALETVLKDGKIFVLPDDSFVKPVFNDYYFPVSGEIVPISHLNEVTGAVFSFRNVSEEELQKHFFNLAVEDSSIYPWQFNQNTNCFTFPVGFLKIFGFEENVRIISLKEIESLINENDIDETKKQLTSLFTGEVKDMRFSLRLRNSNGVYEWWEFRSSVFSGLSVDAPYSILGVCQSIQRYKNTEEELIKARDKALETDKLKSAFLANMSHEIRTPLNSIVGFSDLLNNATLYSDEEVKQFIDIINKNCTILLSLINDILDLSRIESGSMDFVFANHNLSLILRTAYDSQQLNMPDGVKFLLDIPEGEKTYIITDSLRLLQVINNLVNNSVKFTTQGSITLGYDTSSDGDILIFVEDTGIGITEESISHIFERFYKVDNFTQGAGLGLSICQTIVERLNGKIEIQSEYGKGTRFTIRIPRFCE